jgi:hypothetical protein
MENIQIIVIADQNTEASRTLGAALAESAALEAPHIVLHPSEVGRVKDAIRAVPAVAVLLIADTTQGAIAIGQVAKAAALLANGDQLVELVTAHAPDEALAALPKDLVEPWDGNGKSYAAGALVRGEGDTFYRCLQAHTSQVGWAPEAAPSLWARVGNPADEWPEWVQPTGANPYPQGAKVSHKGKHWTSTTAGNVWEPGAYGWAEVI